MKLALCLITKGDSELDSVKRAVGSVIDYVSRVYITTNHTHKKTKKWCSLNEHIYHSHLDWDDDFSAQRNFNFSQVSSDIDYILWMDSDDIILNAGLLLDIAKISKSKNFDTVFFDYWYGARFDGEPSKETFIENEITHYRERLIRPGSIVWKKRIHESPVPIDSQSYKFSKIEYSEEWPIAWLHLGADRQLSLEKLQARMKRNQRLLEKELEEERELGEADPRTILYLMKIYSESGDEETLSTCIEMGEEYMSKSGWDQERGVCCRLMSKCCGKLGDHEKAKEYALNAIKEYPQSLTSYLYLARTYFNLGEYRNMKHWLDLTKTMNLEDDPSAMKNILEAKVLTAELLLKYYHKAKRNPRKAWQMAKVLTELDPTEQNKINELVLFDKKELDIASEHIHMFMNYLIDIQQEALVPKIVESMPKEMRVLPFANGYYNKYVEPKVWGDKEICYYATFGRPHFEQWDGNSLVKGIGGSETAVIRLSEEWVKEGYKVTVYGDPENECEINGVTYKPWYAFNSRDKFNIFIQWRNNSIVDKISAKKTFIDLHDVTSASTYKPKEKQVDRFMVKSNFHADYLEGINAERIEVISNGIK